jgi:hypothetical protein
VYNNLPDWLTNGAFLLGWLLGIFLIVWTVIKGGGSEGEAKIKLFGLDLHVTGRAVVQVVLGAVLIVLPLIIANVVRAQVVPPQPSVTTVDRISDPDHSAFVFLHDVSVLDLRGSTAHPLLKHINKTKTNPATLINTMLIRKTKAADTISFTYATSGTLSARCLTHTCELRRAVQSDQHASGDLTETWELTAKITDVAPGQEFTLITEVTYWNAFDSAAKQWFATYANSQSEPEDLSMVLLFPENKPFTRYDLYQYAHGSTQRQTATGNTRVIPGAGHLALYWEIFQAQSNDTYEAHWDY